MEVIIGLIVLAIIFGIIISIPVLFAQLSNLKKDYSNLTEQFHHLQRLFYERTSEPLPQSEKKKEEPIQEEPVKQVVPVPLVIPPAPLPEEKKVEPIQEEPVKQVVPIPPAIPTVPQPKTPVQAVVKKKQPKGGMEFLMGGKAAAFAGIGILIMGIAFLVGYAIQHSWIGPTTRVIIGLACGMGLVVGGYFISRKDKKYMLLSRVLTGGGSALFYFVVYAAYAFYHLINAGTTGVGLLASACAVFGLAIFYRSQSVAVLGVLGAFITPMLLGKTVENNEFILVYVAVVNIPVIALGIKRKWQLLYNLAFVFTVLHYLIFSFSVSDIEVYFPIGIALLFFIEYAALGLIKLRSEQDTKGRIADQIRLLASSGLLLIAIYSWINFAHLNRWMGLSFVLIALLHAFIAMVAQKTRREFTHEILAFWAGCILFVSLALPAQLDGPWVSIGWAIEGVILAWFALKVHSTILQSAALFFGIVAVFKAFLFDPSLYDAAPRLFFNARLLVGLGSILLFVVQNKLFARMNQKNLIPLNLIWWGSVLLALLFLFSDTFWTLGFNNSFSWVFTTFQLLAVAFIILRTTIKESSLHLLGILLLLLIPLKIILFDTLIASTLFAMPNPPFLNTFLWLKMIPLIVLFFIPVIQSQSNETHALGKIYSLIKNIFALSATLLLFSLEILRSQTDRASMALTIFWAFCALFCILFGMKRKEVAFRYFGLVLFGMTTLKVLFIDSSELSGLERIGALIGTGILLLILSFGYQKASAFFLHPSSIKSRKE